jgi:hypothetical protein
MEKAFPDWRTIITIKPRESRPFWTLKEIFKCIDKHWMSVFGLVDGLRKSDKRFIDELSSIVRKKSFWRSMKSQEKTAAIEKASKVLSIFENRPYGQELRSAIDKLQVKLLTLKLGLNERLIKYDVRV